MNPTELWELTLPQIHELFERIDLTTLPVEDLEQMYEDIVTHPSHVIDGGLISKVDAAIYTKKQKAK